MNITKSTFSGQDSGGTWGTGHFWGYWRGIPTPVPSRPPHQGKPCIPLHYLQFLLGFGLKKTPFDLGKFKPSTPAITTTPSLKLRMVYWRVALQSKVFKNTFFTEHLRATASAIRIFWTLYMFLCYIQIKCSMDLTFLSLMEFGAHSSNTIM